MTLRQKVTPSDLLRMKKQRKKITMLTAYDYPTAQVVESAGIELVLVGDSVGNVVLGYESTIPVDMDEQLHHVKAVRRGLTKSLLIADMPYLSFHIEDIETVRNAGRLVKEGGAEAVKLEGGEERVETIRKILNAQIPVMGHIGLTPQSIHIFGGYKVQGKKREAAEKLVSDARALEKAGVFAIVLEGIPWQVSKEISEQVSVPTIGIGAGPHCDGQVLVFHDLTGFTSGHQPKFVRQYCDARVFFIDAISRYRDDVKNGSFPSLDESYHSNEYNGENGLSDE